MDFIFFRDCYLVFLFSGFILFSLFFVLFFFILFSFFYFLGFVLCLPLFVLFMLVLPPMQGYIDWGIGLVILVAAGLLVVFSRSPGWAFAVFGVSGILGVFSLGYGYFSFGMFGTGEVLLPLLTGLFGVPVLLLSMQSSAEVPLQRFSGLACRDILQWETAIGLSGCHLELEAFQYESAGTYQVNVKHLAGAALQSRGMCDECLEPDDFALEIGGIVKFQIHLFLRKYLIELMDVAGKPHQRVNGFLAVGYGDGIVPVPFVGNGLQAH